jgi:hypothetical protein
MLQTQIFITAVFVMSSRDLIGGSEDDSEQAEYIADIYRQFPQGCIIIINPETQQQSEC